MVLWFCSGLIVFNCGFLEIPSGHSLSPMQCKITFYKHIWEFPGKQKPTLAKRRGAKTSELTRCISDLKESG